MHEVHQDGRILKYKEKQKDHIMMNGIMGIIYHRHQRNNGRSPLRNHSRNLTTIGERMIETKERIEDLPIHKIIREDRIEPQ